MNFNKFLQSLFGNKSSRDMKLIQPIVEKVKAEYPNIKALSNDQLRAKTKEIQQYVQNAGKAQREKIAELKATIEDTPIDQREDIFNQIDKLEKEALDNYEVAPQRGAAYSFQHRERYSPPIRRERGDCSHSY